MRSVGWKTSSCVFRHARLRHSRSGLAPQSGAPASWNSTVGCSRLVVRLRDLPRAAKRRRWKPRPGRTPVRQEAGPGRGLDPHGHPGPSDPQRRPGPRPGGPPPGPLGSPRPLGDVKMEIQEAERTGRLVIEAKQLDFQYGSQNDRPRLLDDDHARRSRRTDRPQRLGQDDALAAAVGRLAAAVGERSPRNQPRSCLLRSAPCPTRRDEIGPRERPRRIGLGDHQRPHAAHHRLPGRFSLHARAGRRAGCAALRRRAEPPAAGAAVHQALERAGHGRTDQRPRPGDARIAGRAS